MLFFTNFRLLMLEISGSLNKSKNFIQTTQPVDFCIFCSDLYYGKKWKYSIFLNTNDQSIGCYDKCFCIKSC